MTNFVESFSQRLEHLRGSEPKNSFAARIEVAPSLLYRYLDGSSAPGLEVLLRIVEATGCNPGWLLTGSGDAHPKPDPESAEARERLEETWRQAAVMYRAAVQVLVQLGPLVTDAETKRELREAAAKLTVALSEPLAAMKRAQEGSSKAKQKRS